MGTLGFVDGDMVEKSNLHRQIVHSERSVSEGLGKVQSAIRGCKELNSEIKYVAHEERLSGQNALGIIEGYDLVLDCTDNPATRYLISDACVVLAKTLVSGAAQRLEGQIIVLNYPTTVTDKTGTKTETRGPCYRCIFPRPPDPEMVRGCSEIGILGPVVGCIGTLMASEAIRLIVQRTHLGEMKEERKSSMLLYNAWPADPKGMFRTVMLAGRRKGCVSCGEEEVLKSQGKEKITREVLERGRVDYEGFCGRLEDVRVLGKEKRVGAGEFLRKMEAETGGKVVDVREENEFLLGAQVRGAVNVPFGRILRDAESAFDGLDEVNGDMDDGENMTRSDKPMYFVCQRGNDSQIAAQKLMELDEKTGRRREWIGDVEGGFAAMEKVHDST